MSLDNIENAIASFLSTDTPEVLCLLGKWGVGKTHLWKRHYDKLKNSNEVKLKNYSYVSLFGVGSIQDLKLEIISQNDELNKSIVSIAKHALPVIEKISFMGIKLSGLEEISTNLGFNSIEKSIICIDDIERKSDSLKMKDILGFICYLRDKKNCKVIMLQNSDALGKKIADELKKYAEKVIDYNITLEPTSEDVVDIALDNKKDEESIRRNIIKLQINNFRIIKKIKNHAVQILEHLPKETYQEETIKSALSTLCLYCDAHYAPSPDKPNIKFIMKYNLFLWGGIKDKSELEKKWGEMLYDYGYKATNNLDREIFSFIKNGYINALNFKQAALEFDKQYQKGTVQNKYHNAWNLYHNSLQDNTKEILDSIYCCFKGAVETFRPHYMNSAYCLFKDLGDDKRAEEILEFYIQERMRLTPELFHSDLGRLIEFGEPHPDVKKAFEIEFGEPHPDVKKAFEQAIQLNKKNNPITFDEAFGRIANGTGNQDDKEILRNADSQEFYNFYKTYPSKDWNLYVKEALGFESYDDNLKEIGNKAREALQKLASESLINKSRLKKYL